MYLGRDVERRLAAADSSIPLAAQALLADFHVDDAVEFPAARDQLADVLARRHAVHGRAEARAEEGVIEVLAHDGVIHAADAEDVRPSGDLAVGEQGAA